MIQQPQPISTPTPTTLVNFYLTTGNIDRFIESLEGTVRLAKAAGKRVLFIAPPPLIGTKRHRS